jgi:hypothetical protein
MQQFLIALAQRLSTHMCPASHGCEKGRPLIHPGRAASESGRALNQLHLYLDDMFPTTIGQPLLGGSSTPPRKLTF